MEFCLSIEIQEGLSYQDTLALARAAEAAGFQAALLAEHYYPSSGRLDRMAADAWVFLGALARDTASIRLGSLVSPVTFRHPAVLAKLAASLDHLSGGRAELGIGAGWLAAEHAAYGFDFPPGPARVDLLEEQLRQISRLRPPINWVAEAPLAIAIVLDGASETSEAYDEARVTERLLIAAHLLGLGGGIAWFGDAAQQQQAKAILGIPAERTARSVVVLGYPSSTKDPRPNPAGGGRKPLSELVSYGRFGQARA